MYINFVYTTMLYFLIFTFLNIEFCLHIYNALFMLEHIRYPNFGHHNVNYVINKTNPCSRCVINKRSYN